MQFYADTQAEAWFNTLTIAAVPSSMQGYLTRSKRPWVYVYELPPAYTTWQVTFAAVHNNRKCSLNLLTSFKMGGINMGVACVP